MTKKPSNKKKPNSSTEITASPPSKKTKFIQPSMTSFVSKTDSQPVEPKVANSSQPSLVVLSDDQAFTHFQDMGFDYGNIKLALISSNGDPLLILSSLNEIISHQLGGSCSAAPIAQCAPYAPLVVEVSFINLEL